MTKKGGKKPVRREKPAKRQKNAPPVKRHMQYGLMAVLFGGSICVLLLLYYFSTAPSNLNEHAGDLAHAVQDTFQGGVIPAMRVKCGEGIPKRDSQAIWRQYEIDVKLAEGLNPDAVDTILRREMAREGAIVSQEGPKQAGERAYVISMEGRPFVHLRLQGLVMEAPPAPKPPTPPQLQEYAENCKQIHEAVFSALVKAGISESAITRGALESRTSEESHWSFQSARVELPPSLSPEALVGQLRSAIDSEKVRLEDKTGAAEDGVRLSITYNTLDCMELRLVPTEKPLASPAENGINHSSDEALAASLNASLPELFDLPLESNEIGNGNGHNGALASSTHPPVTGTPQVAILVDDGGYGGPSTDEILKLDAPLTVAILPFTPFAKKTALAARKQGFEVILHMPMESFGEKATFPGSIMIDMKQEEVEAITLKALHEVPGAVGINNHTGSKYTQDPEAMKRFFQVIKDKKLYFIDSRTAPHSVAYELAVAQGISSRQRDLFLDNKAEVEYIKSYCNKLVEYAKTHGSAIGICHFRPVTAQVLTEVIPQMKKEGIKLVHVSKLLPRDGSDGSDGS